jgi:hypothetical protein
MKDKKRYTTYERLMKKRAVMFEGQRLMAEIEAKSKRLAYLCAEAAKVGWFIDEKGEGKPLDHFAKKAWKTLNFRELSIGLTGKPGNISRNCIPAKYAVEVNMAFNALRKSYERIYKNRYAKVARKKAIKESLIKSKNEANPIKRINRN